MTNAYYNHDSGVPSALTRGTSSLLRYEFDLIAAGFTAVQNAGLTASLPGQGGNAGKWIKTNGSTASWAAIFESDIGSRSTTLLGYSGISAAAARAELGGASGAVVTANGTEALTNKAISGASNTLSNIPGSAITGAVGTANALNTSNDYTILKKLSFTSGSGSGFIQSNDTTWGMVYRPSTTGTTASHLWTSTIGGFAASLTDAGVMTATAFVGALNGNAATATVAANALGAGQVWTDVTGSRSASTTYTAPAGRSIEVCVQISIGSGNSQLLCGGLGVSYLAASAGSNTGTHSVIIPPGQNYGVVVAGGAFIASWRELR